MFVRPAALLAAYEAFVGGFGRWLSRTAGSETGFVAVVDAFHHMCLGRVVSLRRSLLVLFLRHIVLDVAHRLANSGGQFLHGIVQAAQHADGPIDVAVRAAGVEKSVTEERFTLGGGQIVNAV